MAAEGGPEPRLPRSTRGGWASACSFPACELGPGPPPPSDPRWWGPSVPPRVTVGGGPVSALWVVVPKEGAGPEEGPSDVPRALLGSAGRQEHPLTWPPRDQLQQRLRLRQGYSLGRVCAAAGPTRSLWRPGRGHCEMTAMCSPGWSQVGGLPCLLWLRWSIVPGTKGWWVQFLVGAPRGRRSIRKPGVWSQSCPRDPSRSGTWLCCSQRGERDSIR